MGERERIRQIIQAPEAVDRRELALTLAFDTRHTPDQARAIMGKVPVKQPEQTEQMEDASWPTH